MVIGQSKWPPRSAGLLQSLSAHRLGSNMLRGTFRPAGHRMLQIIHRVPGYCLANRHSAGTTNQANAESPAADRECGRLLGLAKAFLTDNPSANLPALWPSSLSTQRLCFINKQPPFGSFTGLQLIPQVSLHQTEVTAPLPSSTSNPAPDLLVSSSSGAI